LICLQKEEEDMPTARIKKDDHALLAVIAERRGMQHQQVLHEALELYDRHTFLDELNASFAQLRENKPLWEEELAERELWDNTLTDGSAE
jgi:hypothetical protein